MTDYCSYCQNLQKALKNQNYCSNAGDKIRSVKSNSFFLKANQLHSGKHISRLSIRSVFNGYQFYKTGPNDRMLTPDNYLIINEGQDWFSEIESEDDVEAIIVAFHPDFIKSALYSLNNTSDQLLDSPFGFSENTPCFSENTYLKDKAFHRLFLQLRKAIDTQQGNLFFEQIYFDLFQLIIDRHQQNSRKANLIAAQKKGVREELFQRLGLAKDYMQAHLYSRLELMEISRIAALSPYHFLRLFKATYQITPHQYLVQERMKRAKYLLLSSSKSIGDIVFESGFENHSAFGRVFKKRFGLSPTQMRLQA